MGYNYTGGGTKPLTLTEHEARLASVASGAYRKVRAMAQVVSALTGGNIEAIQDWLMFHRIGVWPVGGEQLAREWRWCMGRTALQKLTEIVLATLDTEERAGRAAADDETRWSRTGW